MKITASANLQLDFIYLKIYTENNMKILLVEDNLNLAKSIIRVLKQENYLVEHFLNGLEAESYWILNQKIIDLVLLDIQLPGKNGLEICKNIREKNISTPILMLTAKHEMEDKVLGFNLGADDYLAKPFVFDELLVRIKALLRRPKMLQRKKIFLTENISVDLDSKKIEKKGIEIFFTAKEFEILEFFIKNKNKVVSQEQIFEGCFDFAKENWSNTIEVHIKNIRKKLFKDDKKILRTVRGMGYCLEIE